MGQLWPAAGFGGAECSSICMGCFEEVTITLPAGSDGKASAYNVGDPGSIPGSGRSLGEGNVNPLQYPCLEKPMVRGAW